MQALKRLEPLVVADTSAISEQQWLELRRQGIGGSDAAAVLGISPFKTMRDLYYEKLGIAPAEPDESNWVQLEIGHLLEDLVARIFQQKTGLPIYSAKKMYRHPVHNFMLATPDYFTEDQDGPAVVEIKTTNYFAKDNWWYDSRETVPLYYESQGGHYMPVVDMNRTYYCCLYGNSIDDVIIRRIERDMDYEAELIFHEQNFWNNSVLQKAPPPYTETGNLVLESVKRHHGLAVPTAPGILLDDGYATDIEQYLALQAEKSKWDRGSKAIENQMKLIKGRIADKMGKSCMASYFNGETAYEVSYKPAPRTDINKDNLLKLKMQYPDIYEKFVTISENRRFSIKSVAADNESAGASEERKAA